eukprot:1363041-Amphidinium_carterae.1
MVLVVCSDASAPAAFAAVLGSGSTAHVSKSRSQESLGVAPAATAHCWSGPPPILAVSSPVLGLRDS